MTSFTFTAEQLKSAPPDVRRWMEKEIAAALGHNWDAIHDATQRVDAALAICTPEEAERIFEFLRADLLTSRVFFELARDTPNARAASPLHALSAADMLHHAGIAGGERLVACLEAINEAFQVVRGDPEATLFGFDRSGHVYVQEGTRRSIHELWLGLTMPGASEPPLASPQPPFPDFTASRLGPSVRIARGLSPKAQEESAP